jgi:hypothetical protein
MPVTLAVVFLMALTDPGWADGTCKFRGEYKGYSGKCDNKQEKKSAIRLYLDAAKKAKIQSEMDAEARAYKKMKADRERNKTTAEKCFMKNGKLECSPDAR